MAEQRTAVQCTQCGAVDDHPKAHFTTGETYHHDCLPFAKKNELLESGAKHAASIIEAAESGTHGSDLLAHIQSLHT